MTHFVILFGMRKNFLFALCVSSALTENEDNWNFDGSLTLNKGKLICDFGSLWYAIVSNMTHFVILFGMIENGLFDLCVSSVLTENEDNWNFHGSLTLDKGKLI